MASSYTEGDRLSDVLLSELPYRANRFKGVADGAIAIGDVLKDSAATGKDKTKVAAAGTGANAIALTAAADGEDVIFAGPPRDETAPLGIGVVVKKAGLNYGSGASSGQKDDTDALLQAVGIIVRDTDQD